MLFFPLRNAQWFQNEIIIFYKQTKNNERKKEKYSSI